MSFDDDTQAAWAREMRERVPRPPGAQYHQPLHLFSVLSTEILRKPVHHFRGLSAEEAETVLVEIRRRYPARRDETQEVWDDDHKRWIQKED